MIQIVCLQDVHMDDVMRIQDHCYVEIVPESRDSMHAKVRAAPDTCFIAQAATGVVGYLIAVPVLYPVLPALDAPTFEPDPDADTLYLHDLALAPEGRGTGAGRALVDAAFRAARQRGYTEACLVAIQGSGPYWETFGFQAVAAPTEQVAAKLASYGANAQLMRARL